MSVIKFPAPSTLTDITDVRTAARAKERVLELIGSNQASGLGSQDWDALYDHLWRMILFHERFDFSGLDMGDKSS